MFTSPWLPIMPVVTSFVCRSQAKQCLVGVKTPSLRVLDDMIFGGMVGYKVGWSLEINTPFCSRELAGSFKSTNEDAFSQFVHAASVIQLFSFTKRVTIRPAVMKWPLCTHTFLPAPLSTNFIAAGDLNTSCLPYYYFSATAQPASSVPLADLGVLLAFVSLCPYGSLRSQGRPALLAAAAAWVLLEQLVRLASL